MIERLAKTTTVGTRRTDGGGQRRGNQTSTPFVSPRIPTFRKKAGNGLPDERYVTARELSRRA
jgi:hypothetical protein